MVERVFYTGHPPRADYRLTAKGKAFGPVLLALHRYGEEWEPEAGKESAHPATGVKSSSS